MKTSQLNTGITEDSTPNATETTSSSTNVQLMWPPRHAHPPGQDLLGADPVAGAVPATNLLRWSHMPEPSAPGGISCSPPHVPPSGSLVDGERDNDQTAWVRPDHRSAAVDSSGPVPRRPA